MPTPPAGRLACKSSAGSSMSTFEYIVIEKKGAVGIVTLNRPKMLNALSFGVFREIALAIDDLEADETIGCILLAGSEKAFAAGADIKEMQPKTFIDMFSSDFTAIGGDRVANCRKPTIAAVRGYALGGGCELAMMCDVIIAADTARFGQPEVTIGTMPGFGGTQRLPRAVGKAKAMDWCLTGRMIDAAEAERSGLVARVVPAAELEATAMALAETIAAHSLPVVLKIKEAVNRAYESSLSEGLLFERREFHSTFALEDQKEGMRAFVEKRKPEFKNK